MANGEWGDTRYQKKLKELIDVDVDDEMRWNYTKIKIKA